MKPKIKCVLFEKPHINHILFLFFFISSLVKQYILKIVKEDDNLSIPVFKLYIYDIGDFLSLIPYIIIKIKSKSKDGEKRLKSAEEINYIYNDSTKSEFKKNMSYIILYMFLLTMSDFIAQISTVVFYIITGNQQLQVKHGNLNFALIFNVIFLFLFSRIFLHHTFYSHHFFSLIIFIICLLVIVILDFLEIKKSSGDKFIKSIIYILVRIFTIILYSFEDVIAKVMFLNYYFTPYFLLLIKAIVQLFYLVIFSLPLIFIKIKLENGDKIIIFSLFKDIIKNDINYLYYTIYLINSFFYNILNFIIIDRFSANHSGISRIFENLGIFIINSITQDIEADYYLGLRILMYILLIIASFIFNEIVVINIFGLANGTQLFLDYKEQNDLSLIHEINSEFNSSEFLSERNSDIIIETKAKNNIELTEI